MTEYKIGTQALTLLEVVNCPKCGALNRAPDFAPASAKSELTCRGCFEKPVVMQSYTFFMPIHYYLAVDCKRCRFVITLAATPEPLQIESARGALTAFKTLCPACQTETDYQPADVIVWSGSRPTPAFVAHPTFLEIHKT
jgi:hypothetical protein